MMSSIKTYAIFVLISIIILVVPACFYLFREYTRVSDKLENITANQSQLSNIAMTSNASLSKQEDKLGQAFLENRLVLSNEKKPQKIDMSKICSQQNGVNCVLASEEKLTSYKPK